MKEYRKILLKNKGKVSMLMIFLVFSSAVSVAAGYSLSWILNAASKENPIKALALAFLTSASLFVFSIFLSHISEVCTFKMQQILKNDLRRMIANKINSLTYDEFLKKDSGSYVSWLNNDVNELFNNCFLNLFTGIDFAASAVFSFIVITKSSWYLGLTAVVLFVIQAVIPKFFTKKMEGAVAKKSKALEESIESFKDTVMGAGVFYLSNKGDCILNRILESSDKAEGELFKSNRTVRRIKTVITEMNFLNQSIIIMVASLASIQGMAPIGIVLSMGNLSGQFFNGVRYSIESFMSIKSTRPLWNKFTVADDTKNKKKVSQVNNILLENVSYKYDNMTVLKEKNFEFKVGNKYAIVGESGSGKTTVLKLIMGLLPNYEGNIYYDSIEQKSLDLKSFYSKVAYVDQQVYLFQDTLRFNITLGENYSDEEIMAVVKMCKLESLLNSLPNGLDSIIKENGKNLSGGQRQRISLARGFIRNASYIIMDEGTSALDEENAVDIETSLMEQKGTGVIIITHNLRDCIKNKLTEVYELK